TRGRHSAPAVREQCCRPSLNRYWSLITLLAMLHRELKLCNSRLQTASRKQNSGSHAISKRQQSETLLHQTLMMTTCNEQQQEGGKVNGQETNKKLDKKLLNPVRT
ncbi:MAG: hypothetical protein ACPIOQ_64985, partial [Promethearchaeia archaeon]